jgi:hypothetical protein
MSIARPVGSRIRDYRNSARRSIRLLAIGEGGARIGADVARHGFPNVEVVTHGDGLDLGRIEAGGRDAEVNALVIVYREGDSAQIAPGEPHLAIPVTSVLIQPDGSAPASESASRLRRLADLFVTTPHADYVHELIANLAS